MKTVRKTFVTLFVTAFSVAFALLLTVLVAAACSEKVTLRFETGDGTYLASVEGSSGGTYQKPQDPEKEGYFFDGWYPDASCTGDSLALPDVLPAESTTYYAKYIRCPLLTLDAEGGSLTLTEHRIRPGTDLSEYLGAFVPQKDGLLFGGWECGGELLGEDAAMPMEDMQLHARYKAAYEVAVFVQSADEPQDFVKSEEFSYTGADWLGAVFTPQPPAAEHFGTDTESSSPSAPLHEGENRFELYLLREELVLRYFSALPGGGTAEGEIPTRYGAHVALPELPEAEGYAFFGWSDGEEEYANGGSYTAERALTLNGSWGALYPNVRGEGTLAVETGDAPVRRADLTLGEERFRGQYFAESGCFDAGGYRGRLAHGGYLPDDSGTYCGIDLAKNAAGEEFGVLTLDFGNAEASYRTAQTEAHGSYRYDYDDAAKRYTGDYVFSSDGLSFRFRLAEEGFLKQGGEKNSYSAYDLGAGALLPDALTLDGYGNGVWQRDAGVSAGSYRGGGRENEWEFTPANGEPFRILLGQRVWSDGTDFAAEETFLYFDPALSGEFRAADGATLTLDGYGLKAVYQSGERVISGPFSREGNVLSVQAENPVKFTLTKDGFVQTGEENGVYEGEKGTLSLDGAGGARLYMGGLLLGAGEYRADGGDWLFAGEEEFRFRLAGEDYLVYDEANDGVFAGDWGVALELDGFGGAVYHNMFGGTTELRLVYADETLLLLSGAEMLTAYHTLSLSVDRGKMQVRENPSATAGVFPVRAAGEDVLLVLDGKGGAVLAGKDQIHGSYAIPSKGEIVCDLGGPSVRFRIEEDNGTYFCRKADMTGEFLCGGDVLVLDGYGTAHYRGEGGEWTAPYRMAGGAAEVVRDKELWRFLLGGDSFTLMRFARYLSPDQKGELLLQTDGKNAILREEKEHCGYYSEQQYFLSDDREFAYRIYGDEYRVYRSALQAEYLLEDGATLSLDGCGLGVYTAGEREFAGEATVTDTGLIVFSSAELPTPSGMLGFRTDGDGVLRTLGGEFGLYAGDGGELFLQGDGVAYLRRGGVWRKGGYEAAGESEFVLSLYGAEIRFRIGRTPSGGGYSVYHEALAAFAGTYRAGEELLMVDGYGATLGGKSLRFVCAGEGGFVACEKDTGRFYIVRLNGEAVLNPADSRYLA